MPQHSEYIEYTCRSENFFKNLIAFIRFQVYSQHRIVPARLPGHSLNTISYLPLNAQSVGPSDVCMLVSRSTAGWFLLTNQEVLLMRSRITILATLLLVALAVMFGSVGNRTQTLAAEYSCKTSQCPSIANCTGDHWTRTGDCTINCYKDSGAPGEIVFSGGANCGTSPVGGGGGGGGDTFFLPNGGYCYENWWWDPECSGPNDPYKPPPIN